MCMKFFFRHLRQSTCIHSSATFTFVVNTWGYNSITHKYHIYAWTTSSSALVSSSSLVFGASHLLVSWGVFNEQTPWSSGAASEVGWYVWNNVHIKMESRKTVQGFLGDIHQKWERAWPGDIVLLFPSHFLVGRILASTPWCPYSYLSNCIWWTQKSLILNTMGNFVGAILLWGFFPCLPLLPLVIFPWRHPPLLLSV